MKYSDIIHVSDEFISVFDLENEEMDPYWKLFIPNETFRDIFSSVIDSLDSEKQRNPVWLQGTFGTGKTYATLVIKHLLCDDEYFNYDLGDTQLFGKLKSFREKTKVFPVIIKGASTIEGPGRFESTVQKAVKKALDKNNMKVAVPSDFEHMIKVLEELPLKPEEVEGTDLEFFDNDVIISKLKDGDADILRYVQDIFIVKKHLNPVVEENIVDWLVAVRNELKENYGIDYLMIFWDEFTSALSKINVEDILLQIQNISEAKNKGLSLFIVSHRTRSTQVNIHEDVIKKVMGRFVLKRYSMEPVATYELMEQSIEKEEEWIDVKNRFSDTIAPLIEKITSDDEIKVKKALENLYPIHPYTAFLATFIAEHIGSTKRSIFKFLHDDIDHGFKSFINTFEIEERYFLTADYLWDFFYKDFVQSKDEKISSSVEKYKLHIDALKSKNEEYLVIFKVILLLNMLYKIAKVGKGALTIPSEENIKNVFIGSIYQDKVDDALNYIDKNIINKNLDGLFELTTNTLPDNQVDAEIKKLRNKIRLNDLLVYKESEIKDEFDDKVIRETEVIIRDANLQEQRLIKDNEKGIFKKTGYLHILLFICKTHEEYYSIKKIIKSVLDKNILENILIVVSGAVLGEDKYKKYLKNKARSIVAEKHNYKEDAKIHDKNAEGIINEWVTDIKRKPVEWYLNDQEGRVPLSNLTNLINTDLSKSIFSKGLEHINGTLQNENLWTKVASKKQAENYQISNTIKELDSNLSGLENYSLAILQDNYGNYIVNNQLEIKDDIPDNHPIKTLKDYIDQKFEDSQTKGQFNLGRALIPLSKPPYGLYRCRVNIAAVSLVLRRYANRLYDSKGNAIDKTKMRDLILSLFEFWAEGKKENDLLIRYGSINEKKLSELINEVFKLGLDSDNRSIDTVRWELRDWIKNNRAPLWLFKYSDYIDKNPAVSSSIDALLDFLKPADNNLPDSLIQDCYSRMKANTSDLKWCIKEDSNELFNKYLLKIEPDLLPKDINELNEVLDEVMPEETYSWSDDTVRVKVLEWLNNRNKKQKPNLLVSFENNNIISVSLNKEATGEIIVQASGMKFFEKINDGVAIFDLSELEGGKTYSVIVSYAGNEKFFDENITVPVEIKRKDPELEYSIEGNVIKVSLNKNATGIILVDINKEYFAKIKNGSAIINLFDLEGGKTYEGKISYEGDSKFSGTEVMIGFKAKHENPNLDVSVDGSIISINVEKEATGHIIVDVNGEKYSNEIIKGNTVITVSNLETGKTYKGTISYEGDNRFHKSETTVDIKIKNSISIESLEKTDATLVKDAVIKALKNNKEITVELIVKYLESINSGDK